MNFEQAEKNRRNFGSKKRKSRKKDCSDEQRRKAAEIEEALEAQRIKAHEAPRGNDNTHTASPQTKMSIPGMIYDKERDRYFPKGRDKVQGLLQQRAPPITPSTAHFLRNRELGSFGIKKGMFSNYNSIIGGILGKATALHLKSTAVHDKSDRGCAEALLMSDEAFLKVHTECI